nr:MAG TPA: hypothetical protein [Caudoviricetes sp.]
MAALDRVFNIAQTGRIDDPTPVDNIMAQYKPREQAQGGLWNGVKNFVGSNGGRMLLGGLAGAALGGLTGRNINEALTGGIMGATGAANGITRRNQYNDMIARQQQERADRLKELENGRNFQREMQQNNLAAQKEAANLDFKRRLWEIRDGRRYAEQQKANDLSKNDAYIDTLSVDDSEKQRLKAGLRGFNLSAPKSRIETLQEEYLNPDTAPERRAELEPMIEDYYRFQNKLNTLAPKEISFTDAATGLSKISSATDLSADSKNALAEKYGIKTNFTDAPKKYEPGERGTIQYFQDQGMSLDEARRIVGLLSPEEKLAYEEMKARAVKDAEQPYILEQQNNRTQNDMVFESYKRSLPPEKIIEAGYMAQSLQKAGYNVTAGDILYQGYKKDVLGNANTAANIGQTIASTDKTKAEIPFVGQTSEMKNYSFLQKNPDAVNSPVFSNLNPVDEYRQKKEVDAEIKQREQAEKAEQTEQQTQKTLQTMMPRVRQAIGRAYQALNSGTGVGQFGGWGWTTGTGGTNRADVMNAQAQINILMRGLLKDMGVGSTELNSAAEAAAYRYQIAQDMPVSQIRRVLDNFIADYQSGALMDTVRNTASEYGATSSSDLSSVSTDDLVRML